MSTKYKRVVLGDIADISSGGTPSRSNPAYWHGNLPWVKTTQIQNCIISKQDVDEWITEEGLKKSSAKMVPQGTILLGMIGQGKTRGQVGYLDFKACTNQNAATIVCNKQCDSWFIFQYLLFNYTNIRALSNSSGQGNLNLGLVGIIPVLLPPLPEQKAIADLLSTWDEAIEKTEQLIAKKQKIYEAQLSKHLSLDVPERIKLKKFLKEVSKRNRDLSITQVLSVTNSKGFVRPEDQFDRQVASDNLSNYKIVFKGEYAYNPSRINVGSIARLDGWDFGVLSPMYTVFEIKKPSELHTDLFLHWLNSHEAKQRIKLSAQGSVRETVSFDDFCAIGFPKIDFNEQKALAEYFSLISAEIDILKALSEKYKTQKRGLMRKMLTGEWRVKPEIVNQYMEA
jgi:type I restriction enzyme S subunit